MATTKADEVGPEMWMVVVLWWWMMLALEIDAEGSGQRLYLTGDRKSIER